MLKILHFKPLSHITQRRLLSVSSVKFQIKNKSLLPPLNSQLLSLKPVTPNDSFVSCTVFNGKGDVIAVSQKFPKWSFLRQYELYPRDLRKIDASSIDIIPTILVKKNCIVINMLYIKALISKDKLYVFDTTNQTAAMKLGVLMYDLESKLSSKNKQSFLNSNISQAYEHKALESVLINIMCALETELKIHSSICGEILTELENEVNRDKLRDLLIKSKNLSLFYQKSLLIREVLDEILENDDDLAGLYLTDKKTEKDDFAELEMLLETYYTQCDEFVQQSGSLLQDIKSTEEIVNIMLDANRNSLMLLELKVTIYTLGITVATLIPAFYGMNLKNFIEESNLGFGGVVFFSFVIAIMVTRTNFRSLRSVTRLSMLNNHSGSLSAKHRKLAKEYTAQEVPTLWSRFKMGFECFLFGKNPGKHLIHTKEKREMVWKWLMEDEKK
ncbi:hypothetical protein Kpol_1071p5 [Vanderwaltozyma polyspora DSM 70294]|uniref:Magnesium transporter n=1 Tax=Vanderwaltozyma polyspora (strain ATCC 22028 / DSM 70294 / BCRC 21397 / CBS 2163 / NBRC 10782 / NRRL Y-8283 / UCD 57-17) TaxID=436907 RepID=A7TRK0_VANPO|nr:uncharacterized protein Kpol_1071p5 [Vanderwaltozyma polyspora DSM 70294]EDO15098.1 hypothetical protein Kpol_1071p5 [Vanderwaltozyma polyspora DSM 70294]